MTKKNQQSQQLIGLMPNNISIWTLLQHAGESRRDKSSMFDNNQLQVLRRRNRTKRVGLNMDNFAQGLREHVRLAPKLTESVKGKLSLGAKIIKLGGVEKAFKKLFGNNGNGEKLLNASQCYLYTTAGPIAGLLFISNFKIAFFSERSIKTVSPSGKILRLHYKVSIPCVKIKTANASENVKRSSEKYIEIVTDDCFDFWFMGFFNLENTLEYLHRVLM